jgi:hypothetical protein
MHEQSFVLNHGLQPKESRKLFKSLQYMKFDLSGREANTTKDHGTCYMYAWKIVIFWVGKVKFVTSIFIDLQ